MKNPYKTASYRPILGESSTKTIKGEKIGFLTGILYLVPSIDVCAYSRIAGCLAPCLSSAGRGACKSVQRARQAKTDFFHADIDAFTRAMCADVWRLRRKAKRRGLTLLLRPNGYPMGKRQA